MDRRSVLITGASSGIGRALAVTLAAEGRVVVACARRADPLETLVREIEAAGGQARKLVLDVSDGDATASAIRAVDEELGGLDMVIANAGVGPHAPDAPFPDTLSWESVRGPTTVNFVLPTMVARGRGHLVGISSLASFGPLPGSAAYCSPKAGLSMMLDCLRLDLRGTGVDVTLVRPGFVRTPMVAHSKLWMPMIMEPTAAAALIAARLPHAPATIDFPLPIALAARFGARIPRVIREKLAPRGA
jgi:NAD(P)-dependent dehydrogenase (short-subunit alcohol dehydrogenase family)